MTHLPEIEDDIRGWRGWNLGQDSLGPVLMPLNPEFGPWDQRTVRAACREPYSANFPAVTGFTMVQQAMSPLSRSRPQSMAEEAARISLHEPFQKCVEHLSAATCNCGFWANWKLDATWPAPVVGEIAASGIVLPGSHGFRAEVAEITRLWVTDWEETGLPRSIVNPTKLRGDLMIRYGVRVGIARVTPPKAYIEPSQSWHYDLNSP